MTSVKRKQLTALFDVFAVILILVSVKQLVMPYSNLWAGPASTTTAMIVATYLLWQSNHSWRGLGLVWKLPDKQTLAYTGIAFFGILVTGIITNQLTSYFFSDLGGSGRFDFVEGNFLAYLGVMGLVWTHGSFFEEMLFRAFLISRGSDALGGGRTADVIVVILLACFFGYRHYYYQGMKGAIVTGCIGLTLSIMYLWFGKRNLLPLIFAHGLVNSISQTQRFLGGGD